MIIHASVDRSISEEWATPAAQQEPTQQQSMIVSGILTTEQSTHGQTAGSTANEETSEMISADVVFSQPSLYPLDGIEGEFGIHDADA